MTPKPQNAGISAPGSSVTKSNHTAVTEDGWRLHLVRTQAAHSREPKRATNYPVILVPGLASSGAYSFDLSPAVSLADWLANRGWDVWTVELRGNGLSDKPGLLSGRSHWWTIDDMVEKDVPCLVSYVCMATGCTAAHCMGHSMGGMILTAALTLDDETTARMRSVTLIGSSCFLEGSWWQVTKPTLPLTRLLYSVPAGATLRAYSRLAFTKLGIKVLDVLYFWPSNTDPALARAVLARNFSAVSPGVIFQFKSAFSPSGLRSSKPGHRPYADAQRLAAVRRPVMLICGDRDKMCPPQGAAKQFSMLGTHDKKLIIVGPASGRKSHNGHFDILMGKQVHEEVFPELHAWLLSHDDCLGAQHSKPPARAQPSTASAAPVEASTSQPQVDTALAINSCSSRFDDGTLPSTLLDALCLQPLPSSPGCAGQPHSAPLFKSRL